MDFTALDLCDRKAFGKTIRMQYLQWRWRKMKHGEGKKGEQEVCSIHYSARLQFQEILEIATMSKRNSNCKSSEPLFVLVKV